jgi:hypothetical protein
MRTALVFCVAGLVACTGKIGGGGGDGGEGGGAGGGAAGGSGGGTVSGDAGSGCEVQALMNARCVSCHSSPPTQGAPIAFTSLASLRSLSLRDPLKTNAERCVARMQETATRMPPMPEAPATAAEIAVLTGWIAGGMPACASDAGTEDAGSNVELSPNLIPQAELFMCNASTQSDAPTRIRRLNRWEWTRNVGGAVTRSWTGFSFFDNPFDPSAGERYSTYATDETLDEATVELFLPIVSEAGPPWAGPYTGSNRLERLRNDVSLRCMYQDDKPTAACVRHYLSEFLAHGVLFRPATTPELDRLQAFATMVLAGEPTPDGGSGARTASITRISTAAWLTTGAMFRGELGEATDAGRLPLTNWELAQQLAYAIGSRAPGATPTWVYPDHSAPEEGHMGDIAGAARDGGIRNPATVEALVRKYAGGTDLTRFDLVQDYGQPRRIRRGEYWLSDGVTGFFREWLGYSKVPDIFKEWPEATSAYDDGGVDGYRPQLSSYSNLMSGYYGDESTLVQQMEDAIARVVVADGDVLKNLLTTRQFYLASTAYPSSYAGAILWTGQIYGTTQAIADNRASRWVTFPAADRAGVLTHPAWLGSHGGNFEDDPSLIHRGAWVRENLLCGYIPPLSSVKVVAQVGPHAPNKNARARVDDATGKPECQGCHQLMNPLGYPFEIYNHAGYLRTRDHAADGGYKPRDGTTTLTGMPDPALNGPVLDAVELSEKFATSAYVKRCFVRHAFRYYMGRDENRSDACTLAGMEQSYDSSGGSFFKMITTLMTSETWKTRRVPGAGE